jgi:hypothetical protein
MEPIAHQRGGFGREEVYEQEQCPYESTYGQEQLDELLHEVDIGERWAGSKGGGLAAWLGQPRGRICEYEKATEHWSGKQRRGFRCIWGRARAN